VKGISKEEFEHRQTTVTQCCDEAVASRFYTASKIGARLEQVTFRSCGAPAVGLVRGHPRCAEHGGKEA